MSWAIRWMEMGREIDKIVHGVNVRHSHFVFRKSTWGSVELRGANSPVLSEQITLTLPNASTVGSFFTIAFRFDMRKTPSASVTVVTIGRPSGMAATARDTAV